MAPLARLERATCGLGIRRSIHLSYRGIVILNSYDSNFFQPQFSHYNPTIVKAEFVETLEARFDFFDNLDRSAPI